MPFTRITQPRQGIQQLFAESAEHEADRDAPKGISDMATA